MIFTSKSLHWEEKNKMPKRCYNYDTGDYELIDRDGFSWDSGEYVFNWDDSEYKREEEEEEEERRHREEEEEEERRHRSLFDDDDD